MEKIKEKLTIENILCMFVILCPILDMTSFIFRNLCSTNFSPTTALRPIIPIIVAIYLFWKKEKKSRRYILGMGLIYTVYGISHLYIMKENLMQSSYSTITHEAQYIINYTFMILNLWIYVCVFRKSRKPEKLAKTVIITSAIYIISIYISILTGTSSSTYIEGMGYKGWFESGNSIGSILILSSFIVIRYIKDRKMRKWILPIILLEGIFLSTLLGTRVGLFGFLVVVFVYGFVETIINLIHKGKINKKVVAGSIAGIMAVLLIVISVGSITLQRRKHLQEIEKDIIDTANNQEAHITGSLLEIKEKIEKNILEEGYMNEAQKQSIMELYQIANQLGIKNNDQRMQQFLYNMLLVKNQRNLTYQLIGNGYLTNYRELVLEMEIPAFLFNFGIIGFILYFVPFLIIWCYSAYQGIKNRQKVDDNYLMLLIGSGFVFALSFFAGYTFFNSSNMIIIIVLNTLLINKIEQWKEETE